MTAFFFRLLATAIVFTALFGVHEIFHWIIGG